MTPNFLSMNVLGFEEHSGGPDLPLSGVSWVEVCGRFALYTIADNGW